MEANHETKFSILVFPWIAHGHVFPYLELSKNLANKNFYIYFCSTPVILDSIKTSIQVDNSSFQLVELQLPSFPDLPPHLHTMKDVPPNLMNRLYQAFHMSVSSFTGIITELKPDLLIFDAFQTWAANIASSMNIPAVHFATTGAAAYSFYYHKLIDKDSPFPFPAVYLKDEESKASRSTKIGVLLKEMDGQNLTYVHFKLSYDIVLMKTCRAIEGQYVDYLSVLCKKKVVSSGPLVTRSNNQEKGCEIMEWLSKNPLFSTLFISFGSENYLSKYQMEEIAKGLELCDVNFIWVVKSPVGEATNIDEVMPKGFLDRTKHRGIIVQRWVPQDKILAHKSVGAFMSHCGMSSTIESFYFGVPIIAAPLKLDQPLNGRLAVGAGIGVEVVKDEDGNFRRDEVASAINKVFVEKSGEELRLRAMELSEKMKNEEAEAMSETAEELLKVCMKYKQRT